MMDLRAKANELLAALAERLDAGSLSLDGQADAAVLDVGPVPILFALSDDTDELVSVARIAPLPEQGKARSEALKALMEGNYAWGGTGGGILGQEEESGFICLSRRHDLTTAMPSDFTEEMQRQRSLACFWLEKLTGAGGRPLGMKV
jgi:hypothetical protein